MNGAGGVASLALYVAACVIAAALVGAVAWSFLGPASRQAMLVSAALAVAVQMVSFTVAWRFRARRLLLGWGVGSVLRLVALVGYAVAVAQTRPAALATSLVSFVGFLFVMTVVEPIFLRR